MQFKYYSKEIKNIEKLDPNLENGESKIFEIELDIDIKLENDDYVSTEKIYFIIYKNKINDSYIFQLLSNSDLFFDYKNYFDRLKFDKLKLNIEFNEFHESLINLLSNKNKKNNFQIIINKNGLCYFIIINNYKFKTIELLNLEFKISNEDDIKKFITFKFGVLKKKSDYLTNKLEIIYNLIKLKNPNLLTQFTNCYNNKIK